MTFPDAGPAGRDAANPARSMPSAPSPPATPSTHIGPGTPSAPSAHAVPSAPPPGHPSTALETTRRSTAVAVRGNRDPDATMALDMLIGTAVIVGGIGARVVGGVARRARPVVGLLLRPPFLPPARQPQRVLERLADRGRVERQLRTAEGKAVVAMLVPVVLDAVLDEIDLTELVHDRVDINALVTGVDIDAIASTIDVEAIVNRVDLDAIAARIDVDAVIDRVDLLGLARYVVNGIDLPEIIRDSTGSMASDAVRGVRMQSMQADETVARLVDRLLRRRHARNGQVLAAPTVGVVPPPDDPATANEPPRATPAGGDAASRGDDGTVPPGVAR